MLYNKETRLLQADPDKWLTTDEKIFVKSMYLALTVEPKQVIEVTNEVKTEKENLIND